MPRKYYNSVAVEIESLPQWLKTGKTRKVAKDDGETERLKKREREKQARRNMKESERVKRYEESMKKKEKMVKQDRRRSEMTLRGVSESGNHGCKIERHAKNEKDRKQRWQVGDGFKKDIEVVRRGKNDMAEVKSKKKSNDGINGGKFVQSVQIGVERSSRRGRTREWVEMLQKDKNPKERCLIGRSWAWFSVPDEGWESETPEVEADDTEISHPGKTVNPKDVPSSWPISRFSLDDCLYSSIKKPSTAQSMTEATVHHVVPVTGGADRDNKSEASHTEISKGKDCTKKSFMFRVVSIFRCICRRGKRKTV